MQLDEFVTATLGQIIAGVRGAQAAEGDGGAKINPAFQSATAGRYLELDGGAVQDVAFDVAVTLIESEKSGGGLKLGIAGIGASLSGGSDAQHSQVSRIRFSVPLRLPVQGPTYVL